MATQAPPTPWTKGVNPDYTAFVIEVHVCRDAQGNVHSARKLQDEEDEATVQNLGNAGGMEEGSFGLLVEAARQEAMLQVLIKFSNDEEFKEKLLSGGVIADDLLAQVSDDTLKLMWATLSRVGPSIVRETLEQVRDGFQGQPE
jgi:hypothetical protein